MGRIPPERPGLLRDEVYRIRWALRLIDRLVEIHRCGRAEFRWATTWGDHIEQIENLLRLPHFACAFRGLGSAPEVKAPEHKIASALQVVRSERRPLIWTDDDAIPAAGRLRRRLAESGVPLLLISPDPRHGLQPRDIEAAEEFLADPWAATRA